MPTYAFFKRIIDCLLALILLFVLFPLLLLVSAIIYFEDPSSSPFYVQKRIGFNSRLFLMYKFRTMNTDYNSEFSNNPYYCFEGDKRITVIGKILRRYSIDELPQLLNILFGQMSFVGPRPAIHDEFTYEQLSFQELNLVNLRVTVMPGLTGLAQVSARNDISWSDKLLFDASYVGYSSWSRFIIDCKILILTFKELLFSKGVYDKCYYSDNTD